MRKYPFTLIIVEDETSLTTFLNNLPLSLSITVSTPIYIIDAIKQYKTQKSIIDSSEGLRYFLSQLPKDIVLYTFQNVDCELTLTLAKSAKNIITLSSKYGNRFPSINTVKRGDLITSDKAKMLIATNKGLVFKHNIISGKQVLYMPNYTCKNSTLPECLVNRYTTDTIECHNSDLWYEISVEEFIRMQGFYPHKWSNQHLIELCIKYKAAIDVKDMIRYALKQLNRTQCNRDSRRDKLTSGIWDEYFDHYRASLLLRNVS